VAPVLIVKETGASYVKRLTGVGEAPGVPKQAVKPTSKQSNPIEHRLRLIRLLFALWASAKSVPCFKRGVKAIALDDCTHLAIEVIESIEIVSL
jgi:hypothetical protein